MVWLKKLAAGVGAFLTEWAGHPRRILNKSRMQSEAAEKFLGTFEDKSDSHPAEMLQTQ